MLQRRASNEESAVRRRTVRGGHPTLSALISQRFPQWKEQRSSAGIGTSERKTGLYVRNVETTRLVRDERGWLRLAS
jgi:hypothetical protein